METISKNPKAGVAGVAGSEAASQNNKEGRTIVVGDLHGCFNEALELLETLKVTQRDRVIFAGDLIDRGPKPRECVELAMQHEAVLGNHEERALQQRHRALERFSDDHRATQLALSDRHFEYLKTLPLFIRLPQFGAAVVHAGVFPGTPLEFQKPNHLLHIQNICPPSTKSYWPSKAPQEFTFWTNHYNAWARETHSAPERIIFGHSVLNRPLITPFAVGIDTGGVFGLGLSALVLPDWEVVTVKTRDYCGGRKSVATYAVQEGVLAFS
jgi:Calcineurin-like phosphoesterase